MLEEGGGAFRSLQLQPTGGPTAPWMAKVCVHSNKSHLWRFILVEGYACSILYIRVKMNRTNGAGVDVYYITPCGRRLVTIAIMYGVYSAIVMLYIILMYVAISGRSAAVL